MGVVAVVGRAQGMVCVAGGAAGAAREVARGVGDVMV